MPKFSAYMRGEEGPQGQIGQASLLDGIVSSTTELPSNYSNQKNLTYYVQQEDGPHLYVYTTTEAKWTDLGTVKGNKGDTGLAAGFTTNQIVSVSTLASNTTPIVSISTIASSPNTEKQFDFYFGIPKGEAAGFSTNQNVSVTTLPSSSAPTVTISADNNSPNTAKVFDFNFGIPQGEAAGFGEPTISVSTILPTSPASGTVTATGSSTTKVFNFHFDIPQGLRGEPGDTIAVYEGISFTTGSSYWTSSSTLTIPRGENKKLPIYIYNNDNYSIAATFKITDENIIYEADENFNGSIYLIAPSTRPSINVGSVSSTTYGNSPSVSINPISTTSDVYFDFIIPQGPQGETALTAEVGTVSSTTGNPKVTITGDQNLLFNFELPTGAKGDITTVEVDSLIETLPNGSLATIETTSTSTGIRLKFKLPPSDTYGLSDFATMDKVPLADGQYVSGVLPVTNGGTGYSSLTQNAVLLGNGGNNLKIKTSTPGALYSTANNAEPVFGVLPIQQGGTGANTTTGIRNNLGLGNTTGPVPVANGGTGATTSASAAVNLNVLPLTGGILTGNLYFSNSNNRIISFTTGTDDYFTIRAAATQTDAGYGEIATGTDGNEPIYVRQYAGTSVKRTITLLDASGSTKFPGTVEANKLLLTNALSIEYGGTGTTDGTAPYATSLKTARSIQTNLASENAANFNGTANITPGIAGTLQISHGGTGATNATTAIKNFTQDDIGTNSQYFLTITQNWARTGYATTTAVKTVLGLKSAAYTESSAYAAASHNHSAANITSGTLPITHGGTGATTYTGAVRNLFNNQNVGTSTNFFLTFGYYNNSWEKVGYCKVDTAANVLLYSLETGSAGYHPAQDVYMLTEDSGRSKFVKRTIGDVFGSLNSTNVTTALGYTPANDTAVAKINVANTFTKSQIISVDAPELYLKRPSVLYGVTESGDRGFGKVIGMDKIDRQGGFLYFAKTATGASYVRLYCQNFANSTTTAANGYNSLTLYTSLAGSSVVEITPAAAKSSWRTALGLGTAATADASSFAAASHTHSYLPLSGGSMSGQIRDTRVTGSWIKGRDNASLKKDNAGAAWGPIISMLGNSGDWSIGKNASASDDNLVLAYALNNDYNNNNNAATKIVIPAISDKVSRYLFPMVVQTTDPGAGSTLATNTLLLVYE